MDIMGLVIAKISIFIDGLATNSFQWQDHSCLYPSRLLMFILETGPLNSVIIPKVENHHSTHQLYNTMYCLKTYLLCVHARVAGGGKEAHEHGTHVEVRGTLGSQFLLPLLGGFHGLNQICEASYVTC